MGREGKYWGRRHSFASNKRRAVSTTIVAAVVVVIIVVALGGYFALSSSSKPPTTQSSSSSSQVGTSSSQTPSTSSSSASSALSSSSTITSSGSSSGSSTASNSSTSSSNSSTSSSPSGNYFPVSLAADYASHAMVQQGGNTEVVTLAITHQLAASGEAMTLNGTAPVGSGVTVTFSPASPVQVPASKGINVTVTLAASATATPGGDTINITGAAGPNSMTVAFTLRVVQYRVVMAQNAFSPVDLTVTAGSTVYWQNLDGPMAGNGMGQGSTGGQHNVVFTTLQGANSSALKQFSIYNYTFTQAGSYFYYSSLDTGKTMNGTITVMAAGGGGMGMAAKMPDFSNLKHGSVPIGLLSVCSLPPGLRRSMATDLDRPSQ